jgi:RNA polymerase sigma-70 factor, ECF subfamily
MALTLPAEHVPDLTQSHDECELVERAKSDPAALAELYRLHYQAIAAHVRRRIGSQADADDVVAETFLAMVRYLSRYRWTGVPFRAWLYRVAANQVNHWAKLRRRWVLEQLRSETVCPDKGDDSSNRDIEHLRLALLTLAPRYQSVLSLYYLEEMPTADIAQALGCRVGTVKSRLARGRAALRRLLEQ